MKLLYDSSKAKSGRVDLSLLDLQKGPPPNLCHPNLAPNLKGPRRKPCKHMSLDGLQKGPRQKSSKSVKRVFSTLFDNFRPGQKRQKRNREKASKSFSTLFDNFARHHFSGRDDCRFSTLGCRKRGCAKGGVIL